MVNSALVRTSTAALLLAIAIAASAAEPPKDGIYFPAAATQTETDEYTRYELLAPDSGKFRITYEVTATTAGASTFYNPIRNGSAASDEGVLDAMTGKPLHFEVVSGAEARKDPLMPDADLDTNYIKVTLARPVPANGQGRIVIMKTYEDRKSYYVDGKTIVFDRPLGIRRNKVVLPAGYEVVGLTVPSQILTEADGRIGISFVNGTEGEAPFVLRAAKGAQPGGGSAEGGKEAAQLGITVRRRDRGGSACPSARIRIATSSISCSSPSRTHSRSITTTRSRAQASTATPTSFARAVRPAIRRRAFSIPARNWRRKR